MGTPLPIEAANIGMADSLILMVMALVVFGPRKLPQLGRQMGKLMYEFRKASNEFKFQMEEELRAAEEADRKRQEAAQPQPAALSTPAAEAPAEPAPAGHNPHDTHGNESYGDFMQTQQPPASDEAVVTPAIEAPEQAAAPLAEAEASIPEKTETTAHHG